MFHNISLHLMSDIMSWKLRN